MKSNVVVTMGFALLLQACGGGPPEPPKAVASLLVSIDAANNCTLEEKPVECAAVATVIRSRYPTSKPRIDICLAKETRFEAASEVMKSVTDAGFTVGSFACGKAPAQG